MLCILSAQLVAEIKRLLSEGLSQRKTAAKVGVSRTTVSAIASGKRPDRNEKESCVQTLAAPDLLALPVRCPRCGHWIYPPCQVCRARAYALRIHQRSA